MGPLAEERVTARHGSNPGISRRTEDGVARSARQGPGHPMLRVPWTSGFRAVMGFQPHAGGARAGAATSTDSDRFFGSSLGHAVIATHLDLLSTREAGSSSRCGTWTICRRAPFSGADELVVKPKNETPDPARQTGLGDSRTRPRPNLTSLMRFLCEKSAEYCPVADWLLPRGRQRKRAYGPGLAGMFSH